MWTLGFEHSVEPMKYFLGRVPPLNQLPKGPQHTGWIDQYVPKNWECISSWLRDGYFQLRCREGCIFATGTTCASYI